MKKAGGSANLFWRLMRILPSTSLNFSLVLRLLVSLAFFLQLAGLERASAQVSDVEEVPVEKIYEPMDVKFAAFHQLAVNDRLLVKFFDGRSLFEWEVVVDGDGTILLPYLGKVNVLGLYPSEAAKKLTESFKAYYVKPWVSVDVVHFGYFEIFLFGTDFPGRVVRVKNGTRLLEALEQNKINTGGQYRRIHLIRGGFDFTSFVKSVASAGSTAVEEREGAIVIRAKKPESAVRRDTYGVVGGANLRAWVEERKKDPTSKVYVIDPLVAVVQGDNESANILLKPGDVIFVPAPEKVVQIFGVSKEGFYELLEEETLGDLLYLSGSVDFQTDLRNSVVERRDERGRLSRVVLNLSSSDESARQAESFPLANGDVIRLIPFERRVFVFGEVYRAGAFSYNPELTVADYLAMAGGMTDNANTGWIQLIRHPRELGKPEEPTEVITVNFKKLQKGHPPDANYAVMPGDVIYVPPKGFKLTYRDVIQTIATIFTGFNVFTDGGGTSRPQGQEPPPEQPQQ